jgi:hypothetical protein
MKKAPKKRQEETFVVIALASPGPKWRIVSEPKPRSELLLILRDQWKSGRLARLRRVEVAKAA